MLPKTILSFPLMSSGIPLTSNLDMKPWETHTDGTYVTDLIFNYFNLTFMPIKLLNLNNMSQSTSLIPHLHNHAQILHVVLLWLDHLVNHKPADTDPKFTLSLSNIHTHHHIFMIVVVSHMRPLSALFRCSVSDSLELWSESIAWRESERWEQKTKVWTKSGPVSQE